MQERVASGTTEHFIVPEPLDHYFINMHTFRNAHLIRASLPRPLTKSIPTVSDRRKLHDTLARQLRESHTKKTAASKAKRALKAAQLPVDADDGTEDVGQLSGAATAKSRGKRKVNDNGGDASERSPNRQKNPQNARTVPASSLVSGREKRHVRASRKRRKADEEDWYVPMIDDKRTSDYSGNESDGDAGSEGENSD
jgi:hypothetical protein